MVSEGSVLLRSSMAVVGGLGDSKDGDPESRLLDAACRGDGAAFGQLFDRHRRRLGASLRVRMGTHWRRLCSEEDLLQEVSLISWRRFAEFDRTRWELSLWLFRITRQVLAETFRKIRSRGVPRGGNFLEIAEDKGDLGLTDPDLTPGSRFLAEEMRRRIVDALLQLPPRQSEVVWYHYFEGLKLGAIGQILSVRRETVSRRHQRALECMKRILGEP